MKTINSQSSKLDEINFLKNLKSQVSGTYVEHIFSDKFMDWFQTQVHFDLSCDIWEYMEAQVADAQRTAQRTLEAREQELYERLAQKDQIINDISTKMQAKVDYTEKEMASIIDAKLEEINRLENQMENLYEVEVHSSKIIESLENQIVQLKIKLYDLQNQ